MFSWLRLSKKLIIRRNSMIHLLHISQVRICSFLAYYMFSLLTDEIFRFVLAVFLKEFSALAAIHYSTIIQQYNYNQQPPASFKERMTWLLLLPITITLVVTSYY